jgi:hypothetical protein
MTVGLMAVALASVAADVASAALPRTYRVQAVDRPIPEVGGAFGQGFVNAGDVNRDGRDDLLVGTDQRGGGTGPVFVISGADGSTIRTIPAPDGGGSGGPSGFGGHVGTLADLGSCPGGTPGATCPGAAIGAPDGIGEHLATAVGVDVGGLVDAGRAYVLDGATGAVLKRLDMPPADLAEQAAAPGGAARPAFGRAILSPASPFGPTAPDLSGPTTPPVAVRIGDLNGGGRGDVVVGAPDYVETGATANRQSPCAAAAANPFAQAGRAYVFFGEGIAGTAPGTVDNSPDVTIRNPAAQPDDLTAPVNANRESFGASLVPVGDIGRCTTAPGAGAACDVAVSTVTADGRPDVVVAAPRTDDFAMDDVGVAFLLDGASLSVLAAYQHPEPQPAALFGFGNYDQPAVGDLGGSSAPDVFLAAIRQNNPATGGGIGYVMNGAFRQAAGPNAVNFAILRDPTPHASENFGTSSAGIGNVVGAEGGLDGRNEVLVGAYGPDNPGTLRTVVGDVHIFSGLTEQPLQTLRAPDEQPGLGFGTAVAAMGDLNGDGFQDYAIGAGSYDAGASADQGRIYLFRSDNSAPATAEAPTATAGGRTDSPASGPAGAAPADPAAPPAGAPTDRSGAADSRPPAATPATVLAGRRLTLSADRARAPRGARVRLRGRLRAFANTAQCQRGQAVRIERRPRDAKRFRHLRAVRSDRTGALSLTVRVGATASYRAAVPRTAVCLAATSRAARVSVTRPADARAG